MEKEHSENKVEQIDLSEDFKNMESFEFRDRLRQLDKESVLKIFVDLSLVDDKQRFIGIARRLKAFLEMKPQGQERFVTIRARKEQVMWEPNVFSSGVSLERVD